MKIVSMAQEHGEGDHDYMMCGGKFGWGLTINLNEDQCEALGLTKALRAGTKVSLQGIGIVASATESVERDGEDSGPDISLSIQITDLGVTAQGKLSNAAEVLYGKGE